MQSTIPPVPFDAQNALTSVAEKTKSTGLIYHSRNILFRALEIACWLIFLGLIVTAIWLPSEKIFFELGSAVGTDAHQQQISDIVQTVMMYMKGLIVGIAVLFLVVGLLIRQVRNKFTLLKEVYDLTHDKVIPKNKTE